MTDQPVASTKLSVGNALTDGSGISALTSSKVLKDFVADFLISGAAALVGVGVTGIGDVVAAPQVALFAVLGAAARVIYRTVLRWATT